MIDTTLTHDISCNVGRAAQLELEGDYNSELRHLLFAAKDIIMALKVYRVDRMYRPPTEWMDLPIAKRHAATFQHISNRVAELIEDGV